MKSEKDAVNPDFFEKTPLFLERNRYKQSIIFINDAAMFATLLLFYLACYTLGSLFYLLDCCIKKRFFLNAFFNSIQAFFNSNRP